MGPATPLIFPKAVLLFLGFFFFFYLLMQLVCSLKGILLWGFLCGYLSPSSFWPLSVLGCSDSFRGPLRERGVVASSPHDLFFRMTGVRRTDRRQELRVLFSCFFFCFFFDDGCPCSLLGTHFIRLSECFEVLPPGDFVVFLFLFLRLVALCVSLWAGGAPLAAFSLPLPLWRFFPLGGWVPLAVFSPCFPPVSWVGGGAILSVLFLLLLSLASCIFSSV